MTSAELRRFRQMFRVLEDYFDAGRLVLLEVDGGYVFFTSDKLHKAYGGAGSGQWLDIPDRFFFVLNYKPVEKNGEKKRSYDIELFDYGYKEDRETFLERAIGLEGLEVLDERKGYTFLYRHPLLEGKEKKSEEEANTAKMVEELRRFIKDKLPRLEDVI